MGRKGMMFLALGWLLAVVVAPRDLLSKLRG